MVFKVLRYPGRRSGTFSRSRRDLIRTPSTGQGGIGGAAHERTVAVGYSRSCPFENRSKPLSAADTHGFQTIFYFPAFHFMHEVRQYSPACRADRVTQ